MVASPTTALLRTGNRTITSRATVFRRLVDLVLTAVRQAVPLGGVFALGWQPAVALAVYWFESLLLVGIAVAHGSRLRSKTSPQAIAKVRAAGDVDHAEALEKEAHAIPSAGINPRDVFIFHAGSMGVFGGFLAGILLILVGNGRIDPIDWSELWRAVGTMVAVLGIGFVFERVTMPVPPVALVRARVDTCNGRWALMWLLGFGGTLAMAFTGRPMVFFQVFAVLKGTWEVWGLLGRALGWKPVTPTGAS
jgi:hypothetical protein